MHILVVFAPFGHLRRIWQKSWWKQRTFFAHLTYTEIFLMHNFAFLCLLGYFLHNLCIPFIPHICHPRHPRRQCKNVKVRGIFSISNVKGTPVEFCTQCVIVHTVRNFTVCNFTQCVILHTVCSFVHSLLFPHSV